MISSKNWWGVSLPDQTNEELVANVNAAFGTDIDPEDFEKILATTASDMVAIAQSQIGRPEACLTGLGTVFPAG